MSEDVIQSVASKPPPDPGPDQPPVTTLSIHLAKPMSLAGRHQHDSVAVNCRTCRIDFIWPQAAGNDVTCPTCGTTETLDVANAPTLTPPTTD